VNARAGYHESVEVSHELPEQQPRESLCRPKHKKKILIKIEFSALDYKYVKILKRNIIMMTMKN